MERALRAVSVERGVDPRALALVAFGGAGPLHACALADALGMAAVIVPARAGVLSAVGLLAAPAQRDLVRSWPTPLDHAGLDDALRRLGATRRVDARRCRTPAVDDVGRLPVRRPEPRAHGRDGRGASTRPTARRNGFARPDAAGRGGRHPGDGHACRRPRRSPTCPRRRARRRDGPGWRSPSRTARSGCPTGGQAEPGAAGALVLAEDASDDASTRPRLQVLISRLGGIADEMGAVLRRSASSPNIKERADCSAAVFTAAGELLAQAEHIPVHLGSMPASVRAAIDAYGGRPRARATTSSSTTRSPAAPTSTTSPSSRRCFADGDGWSAGWPTGPTTPTSAAPRPGSIPADATEIQQEGLRIPPTPLHRRSCAALLLAASRTPDERAGDLDAQLGANVVGVERLAGARRRSRSTRSSPTASAGCGPCWPRCPTARGRSRTCSTPPAPAADQQRPAPHRGDGHDRRRRDHLRLHRHRSAGARQRQRGRGGDRVGRRVRAAHRDRSRPSRPTAARCGRCTWWRPAGTIVAARPPAAVGAGNVEVSQRIADVCLGALAQALPGRVGAAGQGTMNNVLIGGEGWVYYETVAGGEGGQPGPGRHERRPHRDDQHARTRRSRRWSAAFPLRVLRYRLREGSGGAGRFPGGDGIERDLEVLEDVHAVA